MLQTAHNEKAGEVGGEGTEREADREEAELAAEGLYRCSKRQGRGGGDEVGQGSNSGMPGWEGTRHSRGGIPKLGPTCEDAHHAALGAEFEISNGQAHIAARTTYRAMALEKLLYGLIHFVCTDLCWVPYPRVL